MDAQCSKCGAQIAAPWKFCPLCGTAAQLEPPAVPPEPVGTQAEKAPVRDAFAGLLFGMLAVPVLAIVGTMLCLTGLGAFLGVPMILAAILSPVLGPMIGIGALRGSCPWCGVRIHSLIAGTEFYCHGCSKKIVVKNRQFLRGE